MWEWCGGTGPARTRPRMTPPAGERSRTALLSCLQTLCRRRYADRRYAAWPSDRIAVVSTPQTAAHTEANTALRVLVALSFCHFLNDSMQSLIPALYPMLKSSL